MQHTAIVHGWTACGRTNFADIVLAKSGKAMVLVDGPEPFANFTSERFLNARPSVYPISQKFTLFRSMTKATVQVSEEYSIDFGTGESLLQSSDRCQQDLV